MEKLTYRQRRFVDEYLIDPNATQAAVKAGYSKKTADVQGVRMLGNVKVQKHIKQQLDKIHSAKVADAEEVMKYLTSVMRGEHTEEVVVVEGCGDGCSEARRMDKEVGAADRIRAAELIGKRYGLFTNKVDFLAPLPVVLAGDEELED